MKKVIKIAFLSIVMIFSTNVFANKNNLDFNNFWKEYSEVYEKGNFFAGGDIGLSRYTTAKHGSGDWYNLPQLGAVVDVIMPLELSRFNFIKSESIKSLTLPLSVGGNINLNMFGCKDPALFYSSVMIDGIVKYHFNIADIFKTVEELNKFDVYAGLRLGVNVAFSNNQYASNKFGLNFGILLGGNYFFTDRFAGNVEIGLAPYLKTGFIYRIM